MGFILHTTDDGFSFITEYTNDLVTVTMFDDENSIKSRGNAKLAPGDAFSLETGQKLAFARAYQRYLGKLVKKAQAEPSVIRNAIEVN